MLLEGFWRDLEGQESGTYFARRCERRMIGEKEGWCRPKGLGH